MDTGLRRRGGGGGDGGMMEVSEGTYEKAKKNLKKFDIYAKVVPELDGNTNPVKAAPTSVSYAAWAIVAILSLGEIWSYLRSGGVREHMLVDSSLGQKLRINVNITFPALSCAELHVDAMDVAGDYHPYMEQDMRKQRLDKKGRPLGKDVEEKANVVEHKVELPEGYCGSCYGAGETPNDCCNTCEQVSERGTEGRRGGGEGQVKSSSYSPHKYKIAPL
jgi:hypothetical protein